MANVGTTCAEFAGIAAASELAGVSRYASVGNPGLDTGRARRVQARRARAAPARHVFVTYFAAGVLAHPHWGAAARGRVVPALPLQPHALLVATATLGTMLAPWGLAFIQSYAVDKRLRPSDLAFERVDVIAGDDGRDRLLHRDRLRCDAARERPLDQRRRRRGGGVATAGRLLRVDLVRDWFARSVAACSSDLPLSNAYSVSEALGREARVEASIREEPAFYGTYALVVGVGALVVLVPGAPLVPILFITQAINAVLLLPLLAFIALLTRDRSLMGKYATGRAWTVVIVAVTLMIAAATIVLGLVLVGG